MLFAEKYRKDVWPIFVNGDKNTYKVQMINI